MSNKSNGTGLYGWQYTGQQRPDFADEPKPGEESVWDYPRPPAIVDDHRVVRVLAFDGTLLARSSISKRVLETASPPTYYLPPDAVAQPQRATWADSLGRPSRERARRSRQRRRFHRVVVFARAVTVRGRARRRVPARRFGAAVLRDAVDRCAAAGVVDQSETE